MSSLLLRDKFDLESIFPTLIHPFWLQITKSILHNWGNGCFTVRNKHWRSVLIKDYLQLYHVRLRLTFTQQKWEELVVAINKYSEKLTSVHFEYPDLCDFKRACDNMKERLRSKIPWNTMASSFFSMFLYIGSKSTWLVCVLASLERNNI